MYRVGICDDDKILCSLLEKQIQALSADIAVGFETEVWYSGESLERDLKKGLGLDILFLDIAMEGADGMETAEQIRDWKEEREESLWGGLPLLIFVTGHPEYMAKAFSVNAFQYLIKPIDEKEFADVFAQALRECRHLEGKKNMEPQKILVRNGNITRNLPIEDIYYIESNNRKLS